MANAGYKTVFTIRMCNQLNQQSMRCHKDGDPFDLHEVRHIAGVTGELYDANTNSMHFIDAVSETKKQSNVKTEPNINAVSPLQQIIQPAAMPIIFGLSSQIYKVDIAM